MLNKKSLQQLTFALSLTCGCLAGAQDVDVTPGAGKFFISPNGNDEWSGGVPDPKAGTMEGPFATIDRALKEHRKGNLRSTIFLRGGTFHLAEPITLLPSDSGLKILPYKSEQPILSGGKPITGWKKSQNPNIWMASVPEARGGKWPMRMLRVGNELQTVARNPNVDANNPNGSWFFTAAPQKAAGAYGAYVSKVHNKGDWIEWTVNAAVGGDYKLWMLYAASGNRALGITDLANRTQVQVNGGLPIKLTNLPDGLPARWAVVATVPLIMGSNIIRWTNTEGGYINMDALMFSNDPAYDPNNRNTRPSRPVIPVQAEAFSHAECKEIVVPQASTSTGYRDRFLFELKDFKQYRSPQAEIHIFPGNSQANEVLFLSRVDIASKTALVDARANAEMMITPGSRYFVANAIEELDSPGEWYLDPTSGSLYLWPKVANFDRLGVIAASLDHLIEFKGDAAKNQWVEDVTIKGVQFSDTMYSRVVSVTMPNDAAIWMTGAKKCVIEHNQFVNLGGHAVRLDGGSTANEIVGNHIVDLGEGGVLLMGDATTQPKDTLIAGNWIQRIGLVYSHVGAVRCIGATGTKVQHNRIERVPRFAISFESPDPKVTSHNNVAEYNDIQHACTSTTGSGGIEVTGRHKLDTGNVIQFNRILDTLGLGAGEQPGQLKSPQLTASIYLDEYASGVTIRNNILARSPLGGVVVNGGRNNNIENNIFADGMTQQILFTVADTFCEKNRVVKNIFQLGSPSSAIYKHLGQWRPQVLSEVDGNIFWHAQGAAFFNTAQTTPLGELKRWQATGIEMNSVIASPGFTDAARDNYQMNTASPAVAKGFSPIPADKIGLPGFTRSWK